jgi:hypothetical protein
LILRKEVLELALLASSPLAVISIVLLVQQEPLALRQIAAVPAHIGKRAVTVERHMLAPRQRLSACGLPR